ncbi:hypothetical protein [Hyphomicrobium sp.]|uniref:hypothetical protein n=1 Tax=Hyphomicrobium sp. TaxID=82 RepID=UPI0025C5D97C|nr:hypothetical protein [Hyphomicrobium sp.]
MLDLQAIDCGIAYVTGNCDLYRRTCALKIGLQKIKRFPYEQMWILLADLSAAKPYKVAKISNDVGASAHASALAATLAFKVRCAPASIETALVDVRNKRISDRLR